jgi:hypothetical protein
MNDLEKKKVRFLILKTLAVKRYLKDNGFIHTREMKNHEAIKIFAKHRYNEDVHSCFTDWLLDKLNSNELIIELRNHKKKAKRINGTKENNYETKESYKKFIGTSYWAGVRKLVLIRDANKCTNCGNTKSLHIHHKSYQHHNHEHEHIEDLITLCGHCHNIVHEKNNLINWIKIF